jgi:CBS domain containing-hemolysin-like protein
MEIDWPRLVAVPILIALNAFFVVAEYTLVALRGPGIEAMRARGTRGARKAADALVAMKDDMAGAIGAIQICITLVTLLLGSLGEPALGHLLIQLMGPAKDLVPDAVFHTFSTAMAVLIVTLLTVVLSELVPKAVSLQYTVALARFTAVPMYRIRIAISPAVWVMGKLANATTRVLGLGQVKIEDAPPGLDEIRLMAAEAGEQGVLTPRERFLVLNALTFGRRRAHEIMVPRVRTAYLDITWSMDENRRVMSEYLYSRLPVCNGGWKQVMGVVYTKEFLTAYEEPGSDSSVLLLIARPPVFAPLNVELDRLLTLFHESKQHLIFLVDELGTVDGIVTVADVVDELIGEVNDADQHNQQAPRQLSDGSLECPGELPLRDVAIRLKLDHWQPDVEHVTTIGGLAASLAGRVPRAGEVVEADGVRVRVTASDTRRVLRVRVYPPAPAADERDDRASD